MFVVLGLCTIGTCNQKLNIIKLNCPFYVAIKICYSKKGVFCQIIKYLENTYFMLEILLSK